jgi:predicted esterase YcpF (UPF0227 family)
LGNVTGNDYDYSQPFNTVLDSMISATRQRQPDLIVGTSLGGFYAAAVAVTLNIPFVAINPSIDPRHTLVRYEGHGTAWTGASYHLTRAVIEDYPAYRLSAKHGLVLLDRGDDVCNAMETEQFLGPHYSIIAYEGGNHRFAHMEESLDAIRQFVLAATPALQLTQENK